MTVSRDGERYDEVARITSPVADDEPGIIVRDLVSELQGTEARFVRVLARNYGSIPDWHPGHGDSAFIFVDEILVE